MATPAAIALLATLAAAACTSTAPPPRLDPRPVFKVHVPPRVQVGTPFAFYVDLNTVCGTFDAITIEMDPAARTAEVGATFQPVSPGVGCQDAIIRERKRSTMTLAAAGTHTIGFRGYERRSTVTIEAGSEAAPAWSPPPLMPEVSRQ